MGNSFAVKPELPELVIPDRWVDPVTGLSVPKDPNKNLQYRADLLEAADKDIELRTDLYTACSQSVLYWINVFVLTMRIFEAGDDGKLKQAQYARIPFVTWPIQDKFLLRLEHGIEEGESLLTDKSRDAGATWCHIAALTHRFLFHDDESHLMISRKEDAVDILSGQPKNYPFGALADAGTLFGKIDMILSHLPEWMLPRMHRTKMHLVNQENRSRIDGESANASAGSSDRRTSIFIDEMAKIDEAESIKRSTRDVTACRMVCSTPNGAGTTFSKWRMSGQIPVFILPWWEIPGKADGRYASQDRLGKWEIRSPWYDRECQARSPREVSIELNMDHVGSGDTFFEAMIIETHKKMHAKKPIRTMNIQFPKKFSDEKVQDAMRKWSSTGLIAIPNGPWKIWTSLVKGRPDQTKSYTLGIDISKGQGASNSTVSILCNETREKIAEYADANTPPYEFARVVCAAAIWCGGRNKRPLVIWENNGDPGFDFGRQITHVYQYPNIYFDKAAGTANEKSGKRYGWRSSPEKKAIGLGILRRAYAHNKFINHSEPALDEALTYIHFEGGGIGPAELLEESESNRKSHGDRVIADMLCVIGLMDMPRFRKSETTRTERSIGGRLAAFRKRKKDGGTPWIQRKKFDFSQGSVV